MSKAIIDDVAKLAGVSIKTVSRVMNKEPNVRETTRTKVIEAAKTLNYHPNQSARGLAGQKTYLVALLYDSPSPSYLTNMQNGVLESCEKAGYGMVLKPVRCNGSISLMDQVKDFLRQSRVDGLILTPPVCDNLHFKSQLIDNGIAYVSVAPPDRNDKLAVIIDDEQAAFDMTKHLISLGHKTIGFLQGHPAHGAGLLRYAGYKKAMSDAGLPFDASYVLQGYFDFKSGQEAADYFTAMRDKRPTAIFAANDEMAAGLMQTLMQKGIAVPKDISVVGFDNTPIAQQIWPPMTTVHQPIQQMGAIATTMLLDQLKGKTAQGTNNSQVSQKKHAHHHREIPFDLKLRDSSAPFQS